MRPILRGVEVIRIARREGGLTTLLRDAEGIATGPVEVPPPLDRALALMDGTKSVIEIAAALRRDGAPTVRTESIERLVEVLDAEGMLEGARAEARKRALVEAFRAAPVRPAAFAGSAYHGEEAALRRFVDERCLDVAAPLELERTVRGLVAPHMDLWRAAPGYGSAYAALAERLPESVETVLVLGTCHVGMRSPFAFTKKRWDTPLGAMHADSAFIDRVAARARVDLFADEYKHRGEHSIEFQLVFLRHLFGERPLSIVPILCGLGRAQALGLDPRRERESEVVLGALEEELAAHPERYLVVAGADLAHVGPRFGDPRALDERGRARLEARDRASIRALLGRDAAGFFADVVSDASERRVCGTGPLYTLLRALDALGPTRGHALEYTQHVDPDEGSIVSYVAAAFESEG
ncbi:MAG: AmmeMemoRadiSam system protein B [Polyangiaceae bacterium]